MSKLAYSYEGAVAECDGVVTEETLRAAWKSGDLVIREVSKQRPLILHEELEAYLKSLPERIP